MRLAAVNGRLNIDHTRRNTNIWFDSVIAYIHRKKYVTRKGSHLCDVQIESFQKTFLKKWFQPELSRGDHFVWCSSLLPLLSLISVYFQKELQHCSSDFEHDWH